MAAAALSPSANAAPDDACSLLTQSQLNSALGVSMEPGKGSTDNKVCTWNIKAANAEADKGVKTVTLLLHVFNLRYDT